MRGVNLILMLSVFILFMTSCQKDELVNESIIQNYQGKKDHKIKLCVPKGNGAYHSIKVDKSAEAAHINRGAFHPNSCVGEGFKMNEQCYLIPAFECGGSGDVHPEPEPQPEPEEPIIPYFPT